jgi:hypothetical protein
MRRIKSKTVMNAIEAQMTVPSAGLNSAPIELSECYEQANDHTEQRNTFNQCSRNNHVRTDVTGHFRLTRHGFEGRATDAAHTNTSANCGCACTEACEALSDFEKDGQQFHEFGFGWISKIQ